MPGHKLTLVLGGARSGKSAFAETEITMQPGPWNYIATAQAFDDEMRTRIAEHRARRAVGWQTYEAPLALPQTLCELPLGQPVLIDCLTLWLTNLILTDADISSEIVRLTEALELRRASIWIVSNEVGLGIVPDNALARRFRDEAGSLNQKIARLADRVILIAAGLPLPLKE